MNSKFTEQDVFEIGQTFIKYDWTLQLEDEIMQGIHHTSAGERITLMVSTFDHEKFYATARLGGLDAKNTRLTANSEESASEAAATALGYLIATQLDL